MTLKYTNNARTTLNGAITNVATSIVVNDGSVFPTLTGPEYFYMTLEDVSLNREVVKVTARSGNTLTVVRAQDGTTARAFSNADKAEGRICAALLTDLVAPANLLSALLTVDGAGSGLDADTLDGLSSAAFAQLSGATFTGTVTLSWGAPDFRLNDTDAGTDAKYWRNYVYANGSMGWSLVNDAYSAENFWLTVVRTAHTGATVNFGGFTTLTKGGNTIWHAGNDGAGSGLDADLLDGYNIGTSGSAIPLLSGVNTWSGVQNVAATLNVTGGNVLNFSGVTGSNSQAITWYDSSTQQRFALLRDNANGVMAINRYNTSGVYVDTPFAVPANGNGDPNVRGNLIWHAGNDGSGSTLDADLWDGAQFASYLNQPMLSTSEVTHAAVTAQHTYPRFDFYDTDSPLNEKRWQWAADGGTLSMNLVNDAYNASTPVWTFNRDGFTAASVSYTYISSFNITSPTGTNNVVNVYSDHDIARINLSNTGTGGRTWSLSSWDASSSGDFWIADETSGNVRFSISNAGVLYASGGNTIWHAGNDGAGSGLDADLLDGYNQSTDAVANTIARRNANGDLVALVYYAQSGFSADHTASFTPQINLYNRANDNTAGYLIFSKLPADSTYANGDNNGTILWYGQGSAGAQAVSATIYSEYNGTRGTTWAASTLIFGAVQISGSYKYLMITPNGTVTYDTNIMWHAGNDGAGSGLDADLWDGNQFASYLNQAVLTSSFPQFTGVSVVNTSSAGFIMNSDYPYLDWKMVNGTANQKKWRMNGDGNFTFQMLNDAENAGTGVFVISGRSSYTSATFDFGSAITLTKAGNTIWHAGNDGAGSGLDADLLDGVQLSAIGQLAGTQTWTGANTFSTTTASSPITVISTDDGNGAVGIDMWKNSPTPAANDFLANIRIYGQNASGVQTMMSRYRTQVLDTTAASENATTQFGVRIAGSLVDVLLLGATSIENRFVMPTDSIVSSHGTSGYGAFQAVSSGTNTAYTFWNNVTTGELARISVTNAKSFLVSMNGGSTSHMNLTSTGAVTFAGDVTANSDERLKENITLIYDALNTIRKIRGVTFTRKDGDNTRSMGVIAQDLVRAGVPELVRENEDGYLSVAYGNTVGLLIEGIKELERRLADLEARAA